MMKTVSAMTMRRQFGGLLDEVRTTAHPVLIERDGAPMAMLVPLPAAVEASDERQRRRDALNRLCSLSKTTQRGHDPDTWLEGERMGWTGREL